jgi:hypothetical protein
MPSWFDSAQQQAVSGATTGAAAIPSIQNTVAGQAINTLNGPNNPFNQAQGSLNTIATGAANPWLTDASGNVTPNTNTALGGLFSAQDQQLKTLLPQYEAPGTAGSIAGGNFGSLRGQTAANTAVTNAQADLFSKQMQAALSNQQTGVNAATGLGNVGEQGVATETKLGQVQQADPMAQSAALASLLKNISAPTTETATTHASPLSAITALGNLYKNVSGIAGADATAGNKPVGTQVGNILNSVFGNWAKGIDKSTGADQLGNTGYDQLMAPGIDQAGADQTGLGGLTPNTGGDFAPGVDQFNSVWGS